MEHSRGFKLDCIVYATKNTIQNNMIASGGNLTNRNSLPNLVFGNFSRRSSSGESVETLALTEYY